MNSTARRSITSRRRRAGMMVRSSRSTSSTDANSSSPTRTSVIWSPSSSIETPNGRPKESKVSATHTKRGRMHRVSCAQRTAVSTADRVLITGNGAHTCPRALRMHANERGATRARGSRPCSPRRPLRCVGTGRWVLWRHRSIHAAWRLTHRVGDEARRGAKITPSTSPSRQFRALYRESHARAGLGLANIRDRVQRPSGRCRDPPSSSARSPRPARRTQLKPDEKGRRRTHGAPESVGRHEERLVLLDEVCGELRRGAVADVAYRVNRVGRDGKASPAL
jgi:hypothetical protein